MKRPLFWLLAGSAAFGIARADILPALIDQNNPAQPARGVTPPTAETTPQPQVKVTRPEIQLTPETPIAVKHIQFVGGTVYPLKELLEPFRPYAQKTVPLKTIIARVNEITARYQADGYPLSYAWLPENNFKDGNIRIVLVEGYVAHSDIQSDNSGTAARLKRLTQNIMVEKPLRQETFERNSILMARTPGSKVEANAQLPKNIYGAGVMKVKATQPRIWDITSTLDARKGQNLALVNGTLSNLTSYGDQLGVATLIPLDSSTRKTYIGLNYQQYLNDNGLTMQLKGSFLNDDQKDFTPLIYGANNSLIDYRKKATQYTGGVSFGYPLILMQKKQLSVSGGLDYTDKRDDFTFRERLNGQTIGTGEQHQHIRYPALEFGVNGLRAFDKASISSRLTVRQGLDALGADAAPSAGTDINFTQWKGNVDASWLIGEKWRLGGALDGMWSDNDLPEPERVSYGAQRYGRGYSDGEATGDYGYGGQVELRYLHMRKESTWLSTVQPYVLADTAQTWFNRPGIRHQRLASVAAGVTIGDTRHYSLSVEAARPVGDKPINSDGRDWRYSLTVSWNFNNLR